MRPWLVALPACVTTAVVHAQPVTVTVPRNAVLVNYERVRLGQREALEGGAFVARTDDGAASWYNPAGLARAERTQINASANAYEWTSLGVDGVGASAGRARFSSTGTLLSGVLAGPIVKSERWRVGAMLAKPLMWRPARVDAAFEVPTAGTPTRVDYATTGDITQYVPGVAVGYAPGGRAGRLRLGAGLAGSYVTMGQELLIATRQLTPTGQRVSERLFGADGSVLHVLATAGVQWDATSRLAFGGRLVSPGLRIGGASSMGYTEARATGSTLRDLTFRDDEARFDYRIPYQADVGAAWRFPRGAVELDVRHHGRVGAYRVYASDVVGRLTESAGTAAPTTAEVPFVASTHAVRAVTNVALGGNVALSRSFRLHLGLTTDRSPVTETPDGIFPRVNLWHANVGASAGWRTMTGTVGAGFSSGRGAPSRLGAPDGVQGAASRLVVRSLSLMYALSVGF